MKAIANKLVTSILPGVLAGVMVIAGSIIYINGSISSYGRSLGTEAAALVLIVFSIFPSFIGSLVSLFNKSNKPTYLRIGITQIFLGLYLAVINFLMFGPTSYGPKYSYHWEYVNLAVGGSLIFIISGIYLVANNSKLRRKVDR